MTIDQFFDELEVLQPEMQWYLDEQGNICGDYPEKGLWDADPMAAVYSFWAQEAHPILNKSMIEKLGLASEDAEDIYNASFKVFDYSPTLRERILTVLKLKEQRDVRGQKEQNLPTKE